MKQLNGKITISRVSQSDGGQFMNIELSDCLSGIRMLSVEMTMQDFAEAITGLGYRECTHSVNVSNLDKIGKKLEIKSVPILFDGQPPLGDKFFDYMSRLVKPYEVDGWTVDDYDIKSRNYHRNCAMDGRPAYTVSFRRYVDV